MHAEAALFVCFFALFFFLFTTETIANALSYTSVIIIYN